MARRRTSRIGALTRFGDFLTGISPNGTAKLATRVHYRMLEHDPEYREVWDAVCRAGGYRNAKTTETSTPWLGGYASADAEIACSLPALWNRSLELDRDDSIACGLTNTFVDNVVGPGMRPQASNKDNPKLNAALEEVWNERKDELDPVNAVTHEEHQRIVYRLIKLFGDVLVKKTVTRSREPVWFEVIEAPRVSTPSSKITDKNIQNGVVKDEYGRIKGYWVETNTPSFNSIGKGEYKYVDAAVARFARRIGRSGQTRGVPMYHASLQDIRDFDLIKVASMKRTQVAACLALFIKTSATIPDAMSAQLDNRGYGYLPDHNLVPGGFYRLAPEEDIETLVPNFPIPELFPFLVMIARSIGSSVGVCWQTVLHDFGDASYASSRANLQAFDRRTWRGDQQFLIKSLLNWEWYTVMDDARARGDDRLRGVTDSEIRKVRWTPPKWEWVDPKNEALATQIAVNEHWISPQLVCEERGLDYEEVIEQCAIAERLTREACKKAGIPEDSLNRAVAAAPAVSVDDDDSDEPAKGKNNKGDS